MNILTYIAVLLEPRNKLEVLGYVLDDIFGESVKEKIKFVIDTATLFNKYKAKYGTINQEGTSGQSTNEGSSVASNPTIPSERFTILPRMARDVLVIHISTMASESAFSTGGRIFDPFRSSLTPRIIQYLICTADWLWSTMATQKKDKC